nr:uncharacterized protein LOC123003054 [Drosophila takahashii]
MNEILNVRERPFSDESISKKEYHTYSSYHQSFKANDEIRICIQNQDLYVLPHESYLNFQGVVKRVAADGTSTTDNIEVTFRNNCMANFIDEIRYEINGYEIDRTRFVGMSSTLKNYLSESRQDSRKLLNAGWSGGNDIITKGNFNFSLPLKNVMGFAEDYRKVLLNCKHELILLLTKNLDDVYVKNKANHTYVLEMTNISWKIPHVTPSDAAKIKMYDIIKSGVNLPIAFRSWDTYINPKLIQGNQHVWSLKIGSNRERPRFAIIAFMLNGELITNNLSNLKVHLNSETYPYDDLNVNFENDKYAHLYDMYAMFQKSYYNRPAEPFLSPTEFKSKPIIVVDLSYQNETVKSGPIDVRISIDLKKSKQ